ncbi:MAG: phage tail protein [Aeromonas sp.]
MSEVIAAPTLRPIITNKGLEAAIAASTLGKSCEITHVGIGNLAGTGHEEDLVLQGEQFRVPVADGKTVNQFQVNIAALITDTHPSIAIHGIGFYLADGTLFAVYQTEAVLIYHTAGSSLLVGMDVLMSNIPAGSIVVESTGANLVLGDFVPQERTVNGHQLRKDIVLTAADVGALTEAETLALINKSGGDRIGSVSQMMAVQDHLVYDGDKVYLKEGVTLEDAANVFPAAFAKLSGAKGKQFLITTSGASRSGTVMGFAVSNGKALIVYDTGSVTAIATLDPQTRQFKQVATVSSRVKCPLSEAGGKLIGSLDANKFLVIDIANPTSYQEVSSPSGNWGTSYMTASCPTSGGILWATGAPGGVAFMPVSAAGAIGALSMITLPGAPSAVRRLLSFTDKTGNKVSFAVTSAEIYWKAGTTHTSVDGWVLKWSGAVGADFAVYSVEADVVYFAGSYGEYVVCDPRMSPLNQAGDVVLAGAFQGEYETGLHWGQIGDTIFASPLPQPTSVDSPNHYYRLDPKVGKWDSFKHGVNIRLLSNGSSRLGVEVGDYMVGTGMLYAAGNGSFVTLVSSPSVHLQADQTTKGGVANYVRIK